MSWLILRGDARKIPLKDNSVQCCVTSPPYFGLRDYGVSGQLGLEDTVEEYVANLVEVFREVRRVLHPTGVLFCNLGDSYNAAGRKGHGTRIGCKQGTNRASANGMDAYRPSAHNLKPKDLIGVPWMVAFALRADGWYLRSDIIWSKPNPMPESVCDRPTKSHEYIFLLSKNERYFWDQEAVKEPAVHAGETRTTSVQGFARQAKGIGKVPWGNGIPGSIVQIGEGRNLRSVWTISTESYKESHFATFPTALAERCIKAGSSCNSIVLDPFAGAGTTLLVADRLGRHGVGLELKPDYCRIVHQRLATDAPLLTLLTPRPAPVAQPKLWED